MTDTDSVCVECQSICVACSLSNIHHIACQADELLTKLEDVTYGALSSRVNNLLDRVKTHVERIMEISENFLEVE
jgi:hypothetical protein